MNEPNREQIISEIDTKIKYAKFVKTDAVILSSKAAQFCLEHAQYYEQKIKELTEENEAWQKQLISTEEKSGKAYYELACEVEDLRAENEMLRAEKEAKNKELFYEWKKIADETADRYEGLYQDAKKALVVSTVRKMQERLIAEFRKDDRMNYYLRKTLDQIAKEMLEGGDG